MIPEVAHMLLVTDDRKALVMKLLQPFKSIEVEDDHLERARAAGAKIKAVENVEQVLAAMDEKLDAGPVRFFVYFRLPAPQKLEGNVRQAFIARFGEPSKKETVAGVIDTLEAWLALDLADPRGEQRLKQISTMSAFPNPRFQEPWRVLGGAGSAMFPDNAELVEVRTTMQNAEYLAFMLEHSDVVAGLLGAFVLVD